MQKKKIQKKQNKHNKKPQPFAKFRNSASEPNHSYLQAQNLIGNHGALSRVGADIIQPKLIICSPDDKYEREADRVADMVVGTSNHTNLQQAPNTRGALVEMHTAMSSVGQSPSILESIKSVIVSGNGRPLDKSTRESMESRFGDCDFSHVRIHTGPPAAESARSISAKAYTVGSDIVFNQGYFKPHTITGTKLLAHELTHIIQQKNDGDAIASNGRLDKLLPGPNTVSVQCKGNGDEALEKPQIDYARAERLNKHYASRLGWDKRLWNIPRAHVMSLLWHSERFESFADSVATFQREQGFSGKSVNGVLNPRTWDRLRPIGEVVAKRSADWGISEGLCYEASRVRMEKGYKRATGLELVESEKRNIIGEILRGNPSRMEEAGIDKKYWGTHAAGALVLLGKGVFVSQSDIWENKLLKPGAALQVWNKRSDLERIRKGLKPLSWGTSAVFVEYIGENSMNVLHFGTQERWKQSEFEVWIGANLLSK